MLVVALLLLVVVLLLLAMCSMICSTASKFSTNLVMLLAGMHGRIMLLLLELLGLRCCRPIMMLLAGMQGCIKLLLVVLQLLGLRCCSRVQLHKREQLVLQEALCILGLHTAQTPGSRKTTLLWLSSEKRV